MQLVPRGARGTLYILAADGSGYLNNRACTDASRSPGRGEPAGAVAESG